MFYFIDVSIYDSTQWERCDDLTNIDGLEPGSRSQYIAVRSDAVAMHAVAMHAVGIYSIMNVEIRCYYTVGYGPDGSEPSYEFVEARRDQDKYGDGTQSIKMDYYKVYADLFYIGVQVSGAVLHGPILLALSALGLIPSDPLPADIIKPWPQLV